jgi:hypothetical protein
MVELTVTMVRNVSTVTATCRGVLHVECGQEAVV